VFTANHFNLSLHHLRENLLLPQEFVLLAKREGIDAKARVLTAVPEDLLEVFALSLGKEELESCLLELLSEPDFQRKHELLRIMEVRMSARLTRLIWALVQYDYELPAMRELAALAAASPSCAEELLKTLFAKQQDLIPAIVDILCQEGGELYPFICSLFSDRGKSSGAAVAKQYFQQTDEKGFLMNEELFLELN